MPNRHTQFGRLSEVPSAFLESVQDEQLDQRANGAQNTSTATLDTAATTSRAKRIVYACDRPALSFPTIDDSIDWRDRRLTIHYRMDITRDIRPGRADDNKQAKWDGTVEIYSGIDSFGPELRLPCPVTLWLDDGGKLKMAKAEGYLWLAIRAGAPIRERP